jgi:hypothetical protein
MPVARSTSATRSRRQRVEQRAGERQAVVAAERQQVAAARGLVELAQRAHQRRPADPGLAAHEHDAAAPAGRVLHHAGERRKLSLALEQPGHFRDCNGALWYN